MSATSTRTALLAACLALSVAPARAADDVHVVQSGETLWHIAAAISGNPHRWPELYRANRDQIKDPATLYPGQRLSIPDGIRGIVRSVAEESPQETVE